MSIVDKAKEGHKYLFGANLRGANLSGANLRGADLRYANLRGANLSGANLLDANLRYANLRGANLRSADLRYANLSGADLLDANLSSANLRGANLRDANLLDANLRGANLPFFVSPPQKGAFVAFKSLAAGVFAELRIPANAARTGSLVGPKCRAERAKVVRLFTADGAEYHGTAESRHSRETIYAKGATVEADSWDGDIRVECTHGIHFFMRLEDALRY